MSPTDLCSELCSARAVRPSYVALGPIYPTESKKDVGFGPQGREAVERWAELLATESEGNIGGIPLVVIGGINSDAQVDDIPFHPHPPLLRSHYVRNDNEVTSLH